MINGVVNYISNNRRSVDKNLSFITREATAGARFQKDENKVERFIMEPFSVFVTYYLAIIAAAAVTSNVVHRKFLNKQLDTFGLSLKRLAARTLDRPIERSVNDAIPENLKFAIDRFVRESKGIPDTKNKGILHLKLIGDIDKAFVKLTEGLTEHKLHHKEEILKSLNDLRYKINAGKHVSFAVATVFSAFVGGFSIPLVYETIMIPYIIPVLNRMFGKSPQKRNNP